jgi:hypothetical protein
MAELTFRDFAAAHMQGDDALAARHLEALLGLAPADAITATAHFRAEASAGGPAFLGQAMGLRVAVTSGTDEAIGELLARCFGLRDERRAAAVAALRARYPRQPAGTGS